MENNVNVTRLPYMGEREELYFQQYTNDDDKLGRNPLKNRQLFGCLKWNQLIGAEKTVARRLRNKLDGVGRGIFDAEEAN